MKKLWILLLMALICCLVSATAFAEDMPVQEPLTWSYLATIGGTAAFAFLVVQFTKAPLDKVWKIPTRWYVYAITVTVMMVATAFTDGLTVETALLVVCNAFVAALTAYGMYEVTFAKLEKPPTNVW